MHVFLALLFYPLLARLHPPSREAKSAESGATAGLFRSGAFNFGLRVEFLRTHLSPSGPFGPFAEVLKPNRLKVAPHRHILTLAPALSASEWNFCALFILALLHFGPYFSAHQQFQGQIACHVR